MLQATTVEQGHQIFNIIMGFAESIASPQMVKDIKNALPITSVSGVTISFDQMAEIVDYLREQNNKNK